MSLRVDVSSVIVSQPGRDDGTLGSLPVLTWPSPSTTASSFVRRSAPSHGSTTLFALIVKHPHDSVEHIPPRLPRPTGAGSMQRSNKSSNTHPSSSNTSSSISSAQASLRRTLRTPRSRDSLHGDSDDDLADPRPWESRAPLHTYGSERAQHIPHPSLGNSSPVGRGEDLNLPIFDMASETRRRYGEKEAVLGDTYGEKASFVQGPGVDDDDSGKWAKGHGAGPGFGGRRGLPPRQRVEGWVRRAAHVPALR